MPRHFHISLIILILALAVSPAEAAPARSRVPWQFIARTYAEAYGRAPDQIGWRAHVGYFSAYGCSAATLRAWAAGMYTNAEFTGIPYDGAARLLALYRGALGREPDAHGFWEWLNRMQITPWSAIVSDMFALPEFTGQVARLCSDRPYGWNSKAAVLPIPTSGAGFAGAYGGQDEAALQALLDATPPGGTVELAQKAVVPLTRQLVIPAGVTLATSGGANRFGYALMGRLVRAYSRDDAGEPLILMAPASRLKGVWVDGRAGSYPRISDRQIDRVANYSVGMAGGDIQILGSRFSDAGGGTNVGSWFFGTATPEINSCAGVLIQWNLVTSFANNHFTNSADGISTECNDTVIRYNELVDTTDVGVVVFHARAPETAGGVQRSRVYGNTIVNAANIASAAILADPLWHDPGTPAQNFDFSGTRVFANLLWTPTGQNAVRMKIGLALGSRAWYGLSQQYPANSGFGAAFYGNHTGTEQLRANRGVLISGMTGVSVRGNSLGAWVPVAGGGCASSAVAQSSNPAHASGAIQPSSSFEDGRIDGCISS